MNVLHKKTSLLSVLC